MLHPVVQHEGEIEYQSVCLGPREKKEEKQRVDESLLQEDGPRHPASPT
jgi:hypothetical protein